MAVQGPGAILEPATSAPTVQRPPSERWLAARLGAIIALGMAWASAGFAADVYPSHAIRLVVPYGAGGAADVQARELARLLGDALGQPVIVDNRAGANGNIGLVAVARSKPDGYTLGLAASPMVVSPALYKSLPFDPVKDFAPIALLSRSPNVLLAAPGLPANSLADLQKLSRAGQPPLSYASTTPLFMLASELMKKQAGIDMVGVPYKGTAEARSDVMSGRVSVMVEAVGSAKPAVEAGQLKALGVLSRGRNSQLPQVPTLDEQGLRGFDIEGWLGIMAPAGTPDEIVQRLHREIAAILARPELRGKIDSLGFVTFPGSPGQMRQLLLKEIEMYRRIASDAQIQPQ